MSGSVADPLDDPPCGDMASRHRRSWQDTTGYVPDDATHLASIGLREGNGMRESHDERCRQNDRQETRLH